MRLTNGTSTIVFILCEKRDRETEELKKRAKNHWCILFLFCSPPSDDNNNVSIVHCLHTYCIIRWCCWWASLTWCICCVKYTLLITLMTRYTYIYIICIAKHTTENPKSTCSMNCAPVLWRKIRVRQKLCNKTDDDRLSFIPLDGISRKTFAFAKEPKVLRTSERLETLLTGI